jgi:hypothetical protein
VKVQVNTVLELAAAGDESARRALDSAARVQRHPVFDGERRTIYFVADERGVWCRVKLREYKTSGQLKRSADFAA